MAKLKRRTFLGHSILASLGGLTAGSGVAADAKAAESPGKQPPTSPGQANVELRQTHPDFFEKWKGQAIDAPAFYRGEGGEVVMYWASKGGLASSDEGHSWHEYRGNRLWPEDASHGTFRIGNEHVAVTPGASPAGGLCIRRSSDLGQTWSPPQPIPRVERSSQGAKLRGPFVFSVEVTSQGRIIIPEDYLTGREGPDPDLIGTTVSDDAGRTWQREPLFGPPPPLPDAPEGFGEPSVVELANGTCWMVFRSLFGHLWQAVSTDGGLHWGPPSSTGLAAPLANAKVERIPGSEAVVLFWNHARPGPSADFGAVPGIYRPRAPLVFSVSGDNCRSWCCPVTIYEGTGIYPRMGFSEKSMFVVYNSNPSPSVGAGASYGLTVSVYDKQTVASLPPWTRDTIQPYIDDGRVAHWLALTAR